MSLIQVGGSELSQSMVLPEIPSRANVSKSMMTCYEPQTIKNLSELKFVQTKSAWVPKKQSFQKTWQRASSNLYQTLKVPGILLSGKAIN